MLITFFFVLVFLVHLKRTLQEMLVFPSVRYKGLDYILGEVFLRDGLLIRFH